MSSVAAQTLPARFQHTVSRGTKSYVVEFEKHSVRGPNYAIVVQQADGSLRAHKAPPVRTYIGKIAALPGGMASAVRRASGKIFYHVVFEDGSEWIHSGGSTSLRADANWTPKYPSFVTGSGGSGSNVMAAEVGVDVPFSQYSVDNDVDVALEMVEHSILTVNLIYLRDACVLHRIGRVVVRANAARDPYAGMTRTTTLLGALRTQWRNVLPRTASDVVLVATSATGGGVAYVGVVGNPGFSANGASRVGDFSIVWRHEVGHNWSLGHYDGGTPEGRTINSGNRLARISGPEQAKIVRHRNARLRYLDNLGPYGVSIPPRASLDRATYTPQDTALKVDVLDNDHDANGDALRILSFDTKSALGGRVSRSVGSGKGGRDELLYAPPRVATNATDHFRYRIVDATGRQAVGHVALRRGADAELLAHFSMDDGVGARANDSSEYRRDATLDGATWTGGAIGRAVAFDGVDDRVLVPAIDTRTDELTITAWIRRSGAQSRYAALAFFRGGTTRVSGFNFGINNELRYHWNGTNWSWNSGLVVPDGRWTFVALTISKSAATIYMDAGRGLQAKRRFATHTPEPLDSALVLGRDPAFSSRSFRGAMDDVRIYSRALTTAEVSDAAAKFGSPSDPAPRHLELRSQSQEQLTWTPSPKTVRSRVYFSATFRDVRDARASADRGWTTATSWTTPLLGNRTYYWRVDASDGFSSVRGPVWAFSVVPGTILPFTKVYGTGCRGSRALVPSIGVAGVPRIGSQSFALRVSNAATKAPAALVIGADAADVRVGVCRLLVHTPWIAMPAVVTDTRGDASTPLPIRNDRSMLGVRFFGQYVVVDRGGALLGMAALSEGVHVAIGI